MKSRNESENRPSLWEDFSARVRYRWIAGKYGAAVAWRAPGFRKLSSRVAGLAGVLGLAALIATVAWLGDALRSVPDSYEQMPGEVRGALALAIAVALVVVAWIFLGYFGRLSRIMGQAALSADSARQVRDHMRAGLGQNEEARRKLREIYGLVVTSANERLKSAGADARFRFVELAGSDKVENYSAVALRAPAGETLNDLFNDWNELHAGRFTESASERQDLMVTWRDLDKGGDPADDPTSRRGFEEGDNLCLSALYVHEETVLLDVGIATYGQILRSCDALIEEFALFAFLTNVVVKSRSLVSAMRPGTVLSLLPWRRETHDRADTDADLLLRPHDRAAGLGVALVTLQERTGRLVAYVAQRSGKVGTYQNVWHVIPTGMCNCYDVRRSRFAAPPKAYLERQMQREYLEEWCKDDKLEKGNVTNWWEYVEKEWRRAEAKEELRLTGIAYDLLNLRPEVCGAVIVGRPGTSTNPEYLDHVPAEEHHLGTLGTIAELKPTSVVQSGAAALMLVQQMYEPTGEAP